MALVPTTLDVLGPKLVAKIEATTPRITYKGAEGWKHYERPATASRTRRFRLLWESQPWPRGQPRIFTNSVGEHLALLRVRADYLGTFEDLGPLIEEDWHQLRKEMHALSGSGADGLMLILETAAAPRLVGSDPRLRGSTAEERDVLQVDLTYDVRYLRTR